MPDILLLNPCSQVFWEHRFSFKKTHIKVTHYPSHFIKLYLHSFLPPCIVTMTIHIVPLAKKIDP